MNRFLLLTLPLFACHAFAQGTINLNGGVPSLIARHLLVEIDHGPVAQAVTIDCNLNTTSSGGIWLFLNDWETYCTNAANFGDFDQRGNAGGVSTSVTTPARTGLQYAIVQILANPLSGFSADYTGSVVSSAGAITLITTVDYNLISHPKYAIVLDRLLLVDQPLGPSSGTFSTQVVLEAGPTATPVTFRIFFTGNETSAFTVYDDNATPPAVLYSFTGPDFMSHDEVMTTPTYAGPVKIRVVITASGAGGAANTLWELDAPSVSPIVSVTSLDPPPTKAKKTGSDCAVSTGGGMVAGALALVAMPAIARRRHLARRQ